MTPQDFQFITNLLKEKSGFSLTDDQIYLLESRLSTIIRRNNLVSLEDLVNALKLDNEELKTAVVEAVSINNTRFFRNKYIFDAIRNFAKDFDGQTLKIMSAGCASGQEPVSVALLLREMNLIAQKNVQIYALDMSRQIIDRAKKGIYTHYEVQKGLPIRLLLKYFTPKGDDWALNTDILKTIHYHVQNILEPFFTGNFNIVLCRNMLSYMTPAAQEKALHTLSDMMTPGGLLIVGASEILQKTGDFHRFPDCIGCYRLGKES